MADTSAHGRLALTLVTRDRALLDLTCDETTLPGRSGDLGILPGHAALIATLRPGVLTYTAGGRRESVAVGPGFCQVFNDRVAVLVDTAKRPGEVNPADVEARIGELRRAVERADPEDLQAAADRVLEAEAELAVAASPAAN
jgi:F-type H+-transporting ATPase subunit epsilon